MKYAILFLLITCAVIFSCNNQTSKSLLSPEQLETSRHVINTDRDTTIETKNGALLKIPKGALETTDGNTVTLEIKEAYSLEQMIEGGLTTQSNGELLSSGGMIYINAAEGQNVTIKEKIKVAIPADYLQKGMQLYKGQENNNGAINWVDPVALPENKKFTAIDEGRILFQTKCTNCHDIGRDMTGPDLANITRRSHYGHEGGYPDFHFNPAGRYFIYRKVDSAIHININPGLLYYCNMRTRFATIPTSFPELGRKDINNVFSYIQNESDKRQLPFPAHVYLEDCVDSCKRYDELTRYLRHTKDSIIADRKGMVIEKNNFPQDGITNNNPIVNDPVRIDYDEKVSPQHYESDYYQFTIENFGWYNIDMLLKKYDTLTESILLTRLKGDYKEKIKIYLVLPSVKAFVEGGVTNEPGQYAFDSKNGKIRLPQGQKAYIIALSETKSSIAYSITEFQTTALQSIDVTLTASTTKEFSRAIRSLGFDNLKIKAARAKGTKELRKIERKLERAEKWKPTGCDCDCIKFDVPIDFIEPESVPITDQ